MTYFPLKADGRIVSSTPVNAAKKSRLARAIANGLARSLPAFALAGVGLASPVFAETQAQPGTVFVFGYAAGALSDNFSVIVDGKKFEAVKGAIKIDASIGTHTLDVYRGSELAFSMPIYFDAEFKRSLLLTLDKPGSLDYTLQDSTTAEILDAGSKILPGMEASIGGTVIIEPAEGSDGVAKPLANALVRLENTDNYAVTDASGQFKFSDLAAGQYTLVFVAPENFDPIAPITFTLAPKESAERAVSIAEILETLSEIKVSATGVSQQTQATEEERSSAQVAEVINSEQMKRGGDSEASGALKRVTGLSVVGGKFIYVRGMGERYSSVLLNGAQIPSPDPTRRVVPLDLFPTEVLDSVVVQKSYSADMPGEFGGGTVMLRTKEPGRKPTAKISFGLGFQSGTTFKDGLRYRGGNRDWLGFDRVRELPDAVASLSPDGRPISASNSTPEQLRQSTLALSGLGFNTRKDKVSPNANFAASASRAFELSDINFSVLGALRSSNDWQSNEEIRRSYGTSNSGSVLLTEFNRDVTERQGTLTGFVSANATFGDGQRLQYTSIVLRQSSDQTQIDLGYRETPSDIVRTTELEWVENSLIANQFGGEHYFADLHELALNWQVTDARASRSSPAKRTYTYEQIGNEFFFSRGSSGSQIVYDELSDKSREYRLGLSLPFTLSDESLLTLNAGASRLEKDRDAKLRRFTLSARSSSVVAPAIGRLPLDQILVPANIGPNGYQLLEVTRSLDNYVADQSLDSLFLNADWVFGEHWRFIGGVRREANNQNIATFDIGSPNLAPLISGADTTEWLPAFGSTYIFDETQQQIRFNFGRSVSRPDFREYSPAPFLDPILDIESFGNPNLKQAKIDNFDLRWERYFEGDESLSAALFYKRFDQPIERVSVAGTGGLLSYENAESAKNIGIEFDGFMRLERFHSNLSDFFASANIAAIESKVDLGAVGATQTSRNRPLQGQSKYLANIQFGYRPEGGKWQATALYNVAGRRISQVGVLGLQDVFEEPLHQVDLTARYQFAPEWNVAFKLKNILDQAVEFTQDGQLTRRYSPGIEAGFSIEWAPAFDTKK